MSTDKDLIVFEVLNTYGGGIEWWDVVCAVLLMLCGVLMFYVAAEENTASKTFAPVSIGLVFTVISLWLLFDIPKTEVKYEITLKPNQIIDATKWEIVEQRGDIYVITERK